MTTQTKTLLTAEQFLDLGDIGPAELIDGEVIKMSPAGLRHGLIAMALGALVREHVAAQRLGAVFAAETGFKLAPRRVRAPDVAFVSAQRLGEQMTEQFIDGAPDLAVEVVSPSDVRPAVMQKVQEWLDNGARAVWVVDPDNRMIVLYHPDGTIRQVREPEDLRDETVLPGFSTTLGRVFDRTW